MNRLEPFGLTHAKSLRAVLVEAANLPDDSRLLRLFPVLSHIDCRA